MSGDAPLGFAIWNARRGVAYALDAYPDELARRMNDPCGVYRAEGHDFAGPFSSLQQVKDFAIEKLVATRKWLGPALKRRLEGGVRSHGPHATVVNSTEVGDQRQLRGVTAEGLDVVHEGPGCLREKGD